MLGRIQAASSGPAPGAQGKTVLVVEDEDLVREMIADELADAGFVVFAATCAAEAMDILEEQTVGLLFTDIRMPGLMDGWTLAEAARRLNPMLGVIYASGYSDERPRLVSNSIYLRKPYRPSEVVAAIERMLGEPED